MSVQVMTFACFVFSTTHAYVLYATEHAAVAAYECARSNPFYLDGKLLVVSRYKSLPNSMLPGTGLNSIRVSHLTGWVTVQVTEYFCVCTALLLATSLNAVFLLTLLQVTSISCQFRWAYYKFPEPEPWSAGRASLSRDRLCGTVFRLLYGDRRWHCTLSSNNSRPICSTFDVLTNWRNIHHRPALLWCSSWFWRRIQYCRLTYLILTA